MTNIYYAINLISKYFISMEEGKTGQFTVFLNDKKIYNKMKLIGRLPKPMEITEIINKASK